MSNTTNFLTQNWIMTATDESRGYQSNWFNTTPSKTLRLLHIGLANMPRVAHVRLFVTTWNGEYFNLFDGDVAKERSACWDGSMILRNCTSIGAQQYGFLTDDIMYLRAIYEEVQE